jgi:hypothetical protein
MNRCDGCPAKAQHTVTLPSGRTLDLCDHHFREYFKTAVKEPS